jgi:hypothetical protein
LLLFAILVFGPGYLKGRRLICECFGALVLFYKNCGIKKLSFGAFLEVNIDPNVWVPGHFVSIGSVFLFCELK